MAVELNGCTPALILCLFTGQCCSRTFCSYFTSDLTRDLLFGVNVIYLFI